MGKRIIISRDESFAHLLASGKHPRDAYVEAGFGNPANASRKANSPAIKQRVADLIAQREQAIAAATAHMAEEIVYNRQTVIAGLVETIALAKEKGDLGTMRACYVDLGKDLGMFVERRLNVNVNGSLKDISEADIMESVRRIDERLAALGTGEADGGTQNQESAAKPH